MSNISDITIKRVQEIYGPKLGLKEMGGLIGKSPETVRRALKALDLPTRRFRPVPYHIPSLDPVWAAEFRGFFYGEGHAGLATTQTGMVSPVLSVVLRDDDDLAIKDICAHLGGNPYYIPHHSARRAGNPQCRWKIYGFSRVRAIIEATGLAEGLLPAKKREDIKILYEAILARWKMPYSHLDQQHKQILLKYQCDIRNARKYR